MNTLSASKPLMRSSTVGDPFADAFVAMPKISLTAAKTPEIDRHKPIRITNTHDDLSPLIQKYAGSIDRVVEEQEKKTDDPQAKQLLHKLHTLLAEEEEIQESLRQKQIEENSMEDERSSHEKHKSPHLDPD